MAPVLPVLRVTTLAGRVIGGKRFDDGKLPPPQELKTLATALAKNVVLTGGISAGDRVAMLYGDPNNLHREIFGAPEIGPAEFRELIDEAISEIPEWATRFEEDSAPKFQDMALWAEDNDRVTARMVHAYAGFRRGVDALIAKSEENESRSFRR